MLNLIEVTKLYEKTLVVPFVVIGILLIIASIPIIIGILKRNALQKVRNPKKTASLLMITGISLLTCNLLSLVVPIVAWIIATIATCVTNKKKNNKEDSEEEKSNIKNNIKNNIKKRILLSVVSIFVAFGIVIPYVIGGYIFQLFFGVRYETLDMYKYKVSDFENLQCDEIQFESNKGQMLAGYLYYKELDEKQRGVVVIGHGYGGGGHNSYMPVVDYFAEHGYYVFAYDTTGTDNSEGDGIVGLPQQIIDMDYAISYVEKNELTQNLPIVLWGHSWGGYTVTNELAYHPEVKAVVSVAGFDYSMDLIEAWGPGYVGALTYYFVPYMKIHQDMIFGEISNSKAEDAFAKSDAKVMAISANNDPVVPVQYGIDLWKKNHSDDSRFVFKKKAGIDADLAHSYLYCSKDYLKWRDEFNEKTFVEWLDTLEYDYEAKENEERFIKDKSEYLDQPEVRAARANQLDDEFFADIVSFYDSCIQ